MDKLSNSLRITGLASGLDVDSIVKQLMRAENMKVDKVKQQRQLVQWKQDIYRDLMGDLNSFKNTYFNVLNSKDYILSPNTYSSYDVTSTDSTNAITAKANAGAIGGNYKVNVKQLATKGIYTNKAAMINTTVANRAVTSPIKINKGENDSITIDGKQIIIKDGGYDTLSALTSEINSKINADTDLQNKVKAQIKNGAVQFAHTQPIYDKDENGNIKNNEMTITADNGVDFKVTLARGFYTLDEIASAINAKAKTIKDSSGNALPENFASVSADGTKIEFLSNGKDDKNYSVTSATLTGVTTTAGTIPNFNGDKLTYAKQIISGFNDTLTIKIGTTSHEIKLAAKTYLGESDMAQDIVTQVNAELTNKSVTGFKLDKTTDNRIKFISETNSQVTIYGNAANMIGVSNGYQVNQDIRDNASNILSGRMRFTVNGVEFNYNFGNASDTKEIVKDTLTGEDKEVVVIGGMNKSLSDVLYNISTKANVDITYSQLTRTFTLATKTTGSDQKIIKTEDIDGTNFLKTLFKDLPTDDIKGTDAEVEITEPNGEKTTTYQSSNTFTLDSVTYTLNGMPVGEVTFTLNANPSATFDKIKSFIDKYNEIIDKISSKLTEKKQYSYQPLTDEQKDQMKEDDIKKWEERAKQGLIKNDSTLESLLSNMRASFYESVKQTFSDSSLSNIGITLNDMGMSTSSDWSQRGKIIIDEKKLKEALQKNGEKVAELFTKASTTVPSYSRDLTPAQRSQRYKESGIFQRIKDILDDNLSTIRNINGQKGTLLEKAGIKGDYTEYHNLLTDELDEKDKLIAKMNKKMIDKEKLYYLQYSRLETAMNKMNSQQSWFTQQMSGGR